MNIDLTAAVEQASAQQAMAAVRSKLVAASTQIHRRMALAFHDCVMRNFGDTGEFRPHQWRRLSASYARKVRRAFATLLVTGRLKNAVKVEANAERGRVSVSKEDVVYALAHQYGYENGGMPARPYFPIHDDGQVLGRVEEIVLSAAREEMRRVLAA